MLFTFMSNIFVRKKIVCCMNTLPTQGAFYDPASVEDGFALTSGTKSSNNLIERIFQITAKPNLRKFYLLFYNIKHFFCL